MICFPPAGGWFTTFEPWRPVMPAGVDLWAVTLPGHGLRLREPPMTDVRAMALRVAGEIAGQPQLPYAVFGHSMGSMVAVETVRELVRRGLPPPRALGVSGIRAPHIPVPPADWGDRERVVDRLHELEALPPHVMANPKLMDALLPSFHADLAATDAYRAQPEPLDVPLFAWAGAKDPASSVHEVSAWRRHTTGPFRLTVLDAGHAYLSAHAERISKPLVESLSGAVSNDAEERGIKLTG